MPQTNSAKKALRASARRRLVNDRWRKKLRDISRQLKDAITAKDDQQSQTLFVTMQKVIDRAARHHILHPNTASRKKSRLQKAITKIKA